MKRLDFILVSMVRRLRSLRVSCALCVERTEGFRCVFPVQIDPEADED